MASLNLSVANAGTATYNLTSLGTADWIVYPGATPVRKNGGGSVISVAHVGTFADSAATPTSDTATWSDGAGTTSGSTQNLIYSTAGQGVGYSVSFPADTTQRTATIIAGVYGTGLKVTASLSDGSAAQIVDTSFVWTSGAGIQAVIQVTYSAASAGQTLNVTAVQNGAATSNASFQAAALSGSPIQRVAVPYTDAAISYSPYNWDDRGTSKVANNPGAYIRMAFTGTSVNVGLDVSAMTGASLPAAQYPIVRVIIDEVNFTDTTLTSGTTAIAISGLASGAHAVEVVFLAAMTLTPDRWNTPVSAIRFTGFSLDPGATYNAPATRSKRMVYFGDSITEGYNSLGTTTTTPQGNSSLHTVVPSLAKELGAEFGQVGFGAQGYAQAGQGNVPAFNTAWSLYAAGRSRLVNGLLSPAPDYVMVEHGANGTTAQSDVQTAIANLRAAAPTAKIFFMVSAGGFARAAITAAVQANASDANLYLIDLGTGYQVGIDRSTSTANMYAIDGLHRNTLCNARVGAGYAKAIQAVLDAVTPPATTARTVTILVTSGRDAQQNPIPAANLTGLKVSAFDEPTPDLRNAPRYRSSSQTTDASGALTFTMQSTLATGATCGVSVQMPDGRNFDTTALVT